MTLIQVDDAIIAVRQQIDAHVRSLALLRDKATPVGAGQLEGYWQDLEVLSKIRVDVLKQSGDRTSASADATVA